MYRQIAVRPHKHVSALTELIGSQAANLYDEKGGRAIRPRCLQYDAVVAVAAGDALAV